MNATAQVLGTAPLPAAPSVRAFAAADAARWNAFVRQHSEGTFFHLAEMKAGPIVVSPRNPIAERLYTQKDALYILAFKERQSADLEQFEKQKELLRKQALAESRQRALIKFLEGLKGKAQIKVNTAFLEES